MRVALRSEGRLRVGADRLAGPRCLMQARRDITPRAPLVHAPLSPERQHRQIRHQIARVERMKRRSVAPGGREHSA